MQRVYDRKKCSVLVIVFQEKALMYPFPGPLAPVSHLNWKGTQLHGGEINGLVI